MSDTVEVCECGFEGDLAAECDDYCRECKRPYIAPSKSMPMPRDATLAEVTPSYASWATVGQTLDLDHNCGLGIALADGFRLLREAHDFDY